MCFIQVINAIFIEWQKEEILKILILLYTVLIDVK